MWAIAGGAAIVAVTAVVLFLVAFGRDGDQSQGWPKRTLPDPPQQLAFPSKAIGMAPGDHCEYVLRSGNASLDSTILKFVLEDRGKEQFHFSAQLGDNSVKRFDVKAEGTRAFVPRETSDGVFEMVGISDLPDSIDQNQSWRYQTLHYDALGGLAGGERTTCVGPLVCWTPAGEFVCARFNHEEIEGHQAILDGQYWLNPQMPFPIRCRWRRANSVSLIYMDLHSYKLADQTRTAAASALPDSPRRELIDWIKAHDVHGPNGPLVEDLVGRFHIAVQDHSNEKVRWTIGSKLTKDGKAYILRLEDDTFTATAIQQGSEEDQSKSQLKESIGEG